MSLTINDNDDPPRTTPVASFASAASSAGEGAGTRNVTVNLSPAPQSAIALSYTVGGTATAGEDFTIANSGSVEVSANATSATIPVAIVDDADDESAETVVLTLGAGAGYTVGTGNVHTLAIQDNDDPPFNTPVVSVSVSPSSMTEGGTATFTLTASPAPTGNLPVTVEVTDDGNFASGPTGTRTVTIPSQGTTAIFTVATTDDNTDEPNGAVTATVNPGTGYSPHNTNARASVTVNDNDDPPPNTPTVRLSVSPASVAEGRSVTVMATLSRALSSNVTIPLVLTRGTAEVGDFGALASIAITGGRTGGTGTVTTVRDADTDDETFTVALGSLPSDVRAGSPSSVGVTIRDLDRARTVAVSEASAGEGGPVVFRVTVSPPHPDAITLDWALTHGTTDAADFEAGSTSGAVTVPANASSARFSVATAEDRIDEDTETFTVTLTPRGSLPSLVNFASGGDTATGTIRDDDEARIVLPPSSLRIAEEGGTAQYEVRLNSQPTDSVTIGLASDDEAAVTVSPASLEFRPDSWDAPRTVTVTAKTDRGGAPIIMHDASSDDPKYDGLTEPLSVRLGRSAVSAASAWLVRFARTHVRHVLDSIADRLREAAPGPERSAMLAGQAVGAAGRAEDSDAAATASLSAAGRPLGQATAGASSGAESRGLTSREALAGSSFALTGEEGADGAVWSVWGRGSLSRFDGRDGALSLDGDTTTAMLGVDRRQDRWLTGLALAHSMGDGDYSGAEEGRGAMKSGLTSVTPWASMQVMDRITAWGALGYGRGGLKLTPEGGPASKADTETWMAALGARGAAVEAPAAGGFGLALVSDALWLEAGRASEALAATSSDISRLRMGLEGTWGRDFADAWRLGARLDLALRHDGGDAETGFGAETGGGVTWTDPARGLRLGLEGRGLLAHDDGGFRDKGVSAVLGWAPEPATGRGPSLALRQDRGGASSGGVDRLLETEAFEEGGDVGSGTRRFSAEAGWGFPALGGRFTGSPRLGYGRSDAGRNYSLGWRLKPAANANAPDVSFGLKATRRESDRAAPEHGVGVAVTARW
ncbi:MAG: hypothetical protein F4X87_05790 [Chloroflexi bacterium]|nr:hypothetical protein [Chloroflexota bacterium]